MDIEKNTKIAWLLREEGNPIEALELLNSILQTQESCGDWMGAINTMVDISLCQSAIDEKSRKESFDTITRIKTIADEHNIEFRPDYYFHLARTQIGIGEYQNAIDSIEIYKSQNNLDELRLAEANASLGFCMAKNGNINEGVKMLEKSISVLLDTQEKEENQGKSTTVIKKLSAKLKLAQVCDETNRMKILEEIIAEAKSENLGTIRTQAEKLKISD